MTDVKIEILRYPTEEDWKRCLMLARCTQGKFDAPFGASLEWKHKILRSEHSPIRTLMWTIKMENIPYCNSVHFVRHKYGVEHYVQSQRKNPERGAERQDAPVTHIMDINAQELIFMARKRLCYKADSLTRRIMHQICIAVLNIEPVMSDVLLPTCGCDEAFCTEFKPCGTYAQKLPMEIDETKSLTMVDLKEMVGQPVWDESLKKWLLVEKADGQNARCKAVNDIYKYHDYSAEILQKNQLYRIKTEERPLNERLIEVLKEVRGEK